MSEEEKVEKIPPLEVKVVDEKKEKSVHDDVDREYDDLNITDEEIAEFEKDGSSSE